MEPSSIRIPDHPSILVVDDEQAISRMITHALGRSGYVCMEADSAGEALTLLASHAFDVVITDIRMPGMSGIDLLKRIRAE